MKIHSFYPVDKQVSVLGKHEWSVSRLIELSKDLPVMKIPLDHLNLYTKYNNITMRGMVMHAKAILDADLSFPIIIDEDGELMDGRHRIMKALLTGEKTIKAVRFDENPCPCREIQKGQ